MIFLKKIDILLSKKGLKNIDTIIKRGTWQSVKFQLVSRSWTGSKIIEMIFVVFRINVANINSEIRWKIISFLNQFKNAGLTDFLQAVRCRIFDFMNTNYQFIKPFLDKKKIVFEEYGAFNNVLDITIKWIKGTGCFWDANQAPSVKEYSKRKEFAPH